MDRFSEYRIMWVLVLFDLPTETKKERKAYATFRKRIMADAETGRDGELDVLIVQEFRLSFRVAHRFERLFGAHAREAEVVLVDGAVLAADRNDIEAFFREIFCDERRLVPDADAKAEPEPVIPHPLGEIRRLLQARMLHVERAFDIAAVCPAVGQSCRPRPSFVVEPRVVTVHAAQRVVAVAACQGEALTYRHG